MRIHVISITFFHSNNNIKTSKVVTLKWNFIEINSNMEVFDDSPVKKKEKKNVKRPKLCIIYMDQTADDSAHSGFTEQSWKAIFHSILFEKFMWATFALISMKLYSTLLQNLKACIYKFCNCTFCISIFKTVFLEFEIFSILKLKLLH